MLGAGFSVEGKDGGSVAEYEDLQDAQSKTHKAEAEDLTAGEGDLEALADVDVAEVGDLDVGLGGDDHADVASDHGGDSANDEGHAGVGEGAVGLASDPGLVNGQDQDEGENDAEEAEVGVLLPQESLGTLQS